jgi:hypothetical protein
LNHSLDEVLLQLALRIFLQLATAAAAG